MRGYINGARIGIMSRIPGLLPSQPFLIDQDSQHLQNRDCRVHFVEQNLVLLIKLVHLVLDIFGKAAHQIL